MKTNKVDYEAEILSDGHISCPPEIREALSLKEGDKLKVSINKVKKKAECEDSTRNISLRGFWPQLKQVDEKDVDEAIAEWDKKIDQFE